MSNPKTPATKTNRKPIDRSKIVRDTRNPDQIFNDRLLTVLPQLRRQLAKLTRLGHSRAVPTQAAYDAAVSLISGETEDALRELGYRLNGKQAVNEMPVPEALRVTVPKPTKPAKA